MADRDVWIKAGEIVAEHDTMTADFILDQLIDAVGDHTAMEAWNRIATAVDAITDANPQ